MKNCLSIDGEKVQGVSVWVHFPRRRAPFRSFGIVNLKAELGLRELLGLEARVLLGLIFNPKGVSLKELSELVGAPTSSVSRACKRLSERQLVIRKARGIYSASPFLVHFGVWNVPSTQRLPAQSETPETQLEQKAQESLPATNPPDSQPKT